MMVFGKLCIFTSPSLARKFKMKKLLTVLTCAILLTQSHLAWAGIENLPETASAAQTSALLQTPTEAEAELATVDEQDVDGEKLTNVLLSKEQIKQAKLAIKSLTITDFILQNPYEPPQPPNIVELALASIDASANFPKLEVYYKKNALQFSRVLFKDFSNQAKSLPLYSKPIPPEDTAGGWENKSDKPTPTSKITSGWDTGAWQTDGDNAVKSPDLEELSNLPKVWAGPVVNDNVVRYHKKEDKTIARVYFGEDGNGNFYSQFQPLMQGLWAFSKHNNIDIAVSLEQSTSQHGLAFPLLFNLRMPLQIVTPEGLVSATLTAAHLNKSGECNTGSWIELELDNEKPITMWAFLAFPVPSLAKSAVIKREIYTPDTFIRDQEYMVGARKMLAISWKNQILPPLKIVATRFDSNLEKYDNKGKLKSKSTLGSTWGSEVFFDKKTSRKVKVDTNKMIDVVNYGELIHAGEFGDCPTK